MGRFTLFIWKKIIPFFLITSSYATEVEGIKLPKEKSCFNKSLPLQSYGIRKATIFGIKVYVLAYYSETSFLKVNDPNLNQRPICLDVHYLRDFDNKDVDRAWEFQFKESSSFPYEDLNLDVDQIKKFFGEIKGKRLQSFALNEEQTDFYENDLFKGSIKNKNFQKNFLHLFFGDKPPTEELRNQLLKIKD